MNIYNKANYQYWSRELVERRVKMLKEAKKTAGKEHMKRLNRELNELKEYLKS